MGQTAVLKKNKSSAFDKRIHEIDLLRGFLILLVIMDHIFNLLYSHSSTWLTYDANIVFKTINVVFTFYWRSFTRKIIRYIVLFLFCFISGISSAFSKNNLKRAGLVIVVYWIILLGTHGISKAIMPGSPIIIDFNIIGVLGFSTLFYCLFDKKSNRSLIIGTIILTIILAIFTIFVVPNIPNTNSLYMPMFIKPELNGDWLPIFPYITFFLMGAIFSRFTYSKEKKSYFKKHEWERPFCFIGRHTLVIYFFHELILVVLFFGIDFILSLLFK